jgi:adenosylcobyric acid synthase
MGLTVADPYGVEGEPRSVEGLSLLPVHTSLTREKTTIRRQFRFADPQGPLCEGYEIHMGVTQSTLPQPHPLNYSPTPEGYLHSPKCWGTYIHGILDNRPVVEYLLQQAGIDNTQIQWSDYTAFKQRQYDALAGLIRQHVDLPSIYRSLRQPIKNES